MNIKNTTPGCRWIAAVNGRGQRRSADTMGLFAVNNAFAESRPFTTLPDEVVHVAITRNMPA